MIDIEPRGLARSLRAVRAGTTLRWSATRTASCRAYEVDSPRDGWFCVSTRSSELIAVLEGELRVEMGPARHSHRLVAGEACLVLRGTPHTASAAAGTRILVLDVERASEERLGLGLVTAEMTARADRVAARLWGELGSLAAPELTASAEALWAAVRLGRALPLEARHDTRALLGVKKAIEGSFTERVTLADLSDRARLERHYVVRGFTRNFGVSPLAYANYLRLERFVWALLREAPRPLTEVTLESGFADYPTFCRRARSLLGRPPSRLLSA